MSAIIATGGKQYRVEVGDVLFVEKLGQEAGSEIEFTDVLAIGDKFGKPFVKGAKVKAKVVSEGRGKKIVVYKYKRRKGYHKKQGHRQPFTKVEITAIEAK